MAGDETDPRSEPEGRALGRRRFLAAAAAVGVASAVPSAARTPAPAKWRAAVIGHTGRGNYGHGLDRAWLEVPGARVVAVADADEKGRAAAARRLGAGVAPYADYRRMLEREKPDVVTVATRWLDQHRDMVVAAAEAGVRGIYLEKPMAPTLAECDEMLAACRRRGAKLAVAHQTRYSPVLAAALEVIRSGRIGRLLELRARGKEDARGGGEDLWVLGTHVLDLARAMGGPARWGFARVWRDGRPVTRADVSPGAEGIGPLAGDEVHAMWRLESGATATFDSTRNARGAPTRFGLRVHGSKGVVELHTGYLPPAFLLEDSSWSPAQTGKRWVPITSAGPGRPEPLPRASSHAGNVAGVKDLLASIEEDREPISSGREALAATELIVSVFESHRLGCPVELPLGERGNPLERLE